MLQDANAGAMQHMLWWGRRSWQVGVIIVDTPCIGDSIANLEGYNYPVMPPMSYGPVGGVSTQLVKPVIGNLFASFSYNINQVPLTSLHMHLHG